LIRAGILTDTALQRRTLADLLAEDVRVHVVSLSPPTHGQREIRLGHIDVVVATSPALVRSVPADGPPVVLVGGGDPGVETVFRDPVRGWVPANPVAGELSAAIAAVAENLIVLTKSQAKRLFNQVRKNQNEDSAGEALTPRESEVLRMLADGLGNKEIAKRLGISDHTAKFHVAQILAKLGAGSRAEAVAIGMRRGLVPV